MICEIKPKRFPLQKFHKKLKIFKIFSKSSKAIALKHSTVMLHLSIYIK